MEKGKYLVSGKLKGRWEGEWIDLYPILDEQGNIIKYENAHNDMYHKEYYYPDMVELFQPIDFTRLKIKLVEEILPTIIAKGGGDKSTDVKDAFDYANMVIQKIKG